MADLNAVVERAKEGTDHGNHGFATCPGTLAGVAAQKQVGVVYRL